MKKIAKVLVGLFVIMVLLSMCSAWGDDDESSEEQTTETVQETKKTAKKKNVKKQKATTESTEAEVEKPVSYTHRDVYKRNLMLRLRKRFQYTFYYFS